MQSAGVRVKALKLELGKDLKLQASGIWTQLWDQNCDTYNTQLPTLGMERITKAQIVNYKHHQIKRFLQDQVLISFFFFLWKAPIDFIQNFLQDKSLRKIHSGCVHGGDNTVLLQVLFFSSPDLSMWNKFLEEGTKQEDLLWVSRDVLGPSYPIHTATLSWLERCKPTRRPSLPVSCLAL